MGLLENILIAFRSVRANLLRAVLTLLIIALGITALVGILTAIDAAIFAMSSNFSGLGANSYSISPSQETVSSRRSGRVTKRAEPISFKQALDFKERFDYPAQVSLSMRGTGSAAVKSGNNKTDPNVSISGIDEEFILIKGMDLEVGRNFNQQEVINGAQRAIIGSEIVKKLFNGKPEKALDQIVNIGKGRFKVIGVLTAAGASFNSSQDRVIYLPLLNSKRIYGTNRTNYNIDVGVRDAIDMEEAISQSTGLFRNIRKLRAAQKNDFRIFKSDSLINIIKENTTSLRLAALAIGLMTLLGAAIGLMNIMLVSVTERTKEIGINKALGATRRNIVIQFLSEALLISIMGGIVGILLGISAGYGVSKILESSFVIPWPWIILGMLVCTFVGLVSGSYPAMKAARVDPIESLRYE